MFIANSTKTAGISTEEETDDPTEEPSKKIRRGFPRKEVGGEEGEARRDGSQDDGEVRGHLDEE